MSTNNTAVEESQSAKAPKKYLRTLLLPNSSPVPNFVFDEIVSDPDVPHAAIRVLLYLLRKTVGWDNKHEQLSLRQIQEGAAVTRPTAIHAVRVICDCWGLFRKSRGWKGQHSSVFTIGDLTAEAFAELVVVLYEVYGTVFPTPAQLRDRPLTPELIAWAKAKLETFREGQR